MIRNSRFNVNYFNNDFGDATSIVSTINYSPFYNGGVCGWKASFGSPRLNTNWTEAYSLNYPLNMDIVYGYLFGTIQTGATNYKGEGIFQNVKTKSGVQYQFKFRFANFFQNSAYAISHLSIILTNDSIEQGIPNNTTGTIPNYNGQTIKDIFYPHLSSASNFANPIADIWINSDTIFTANQDYKYLVIYIKGHQPNEEYVHTSVLIDSIILKPTEDFVLYNVSNDTTICLGDTITLHGHAKYNSSNPPFPNSRFNYGWYTNYYVQHPDTNITLASPREDTLYYFLAGNAINCLKSQPVRITVTKPIPNFYFEDDSMCFGSVVQFYNNSSCNQGIQSFIWEFGDGSLAYLENPTHVFTSSGLFNTTLKIVDINGDTSSIVKSIFVRPIPDLPSISGLNNNCNEELSQYSILNVQQGVQYYWYIDTTFYTSNTDTVWLNFTGNIPTPPNFVEIHVQAIDQYGCENTNAFKMFNCCKSTDTNSIYFNNTIVSSDTSFYSTGTKRIFINGELVIKSNVFFHNFDAGNNTEIYMGPMAKIILTDTALLTFDRCLLSPGCEYMWDGVYTSGKYDSIFVENTSKISGAISALNSEEGGFIEVDNSYLDHNYSAVKVENSNNSTSPLIMKKAIVSSGSLGYFPFPNTARCGVEIINSENVMVGDTLFAANINYFDGFDKAIWIQNSNTHIFNNRFELSDGIAIYSEGDNTASSTTTVNIGGQNINHSYKVNYFKDHRMAVYGKDKHQLNILFNQIENSGYWDAIQLRDMRQATIRIEKNSFNRVYAGIRLYNCYEASIDIGFNAFTNTQYGIGVLNTHQGPVNKLIIRGNEINITQPQVYSRGIQVINIQGRPDIHQPVGIPNLKRAVIDSNYILIDSSSILSFLYSSMRIVGIDVQNSPLAYVQYNDVQKNYPDFDASNANTYIGIRLENSPNSVFCSNFIKHFGFGIECDGYSPNSRLVRNYTLNTNYGVSMHNAFIGHQGLPQGNGYTFHNEWLSLYDDDKIRGNITAATNWYYDNSNPKYSTLPSLVNLLFASYSLTDPNIIGCGIDLDPSFIEDPFDANQLMFPLVSGGFDFDTLAQANAYFNNRIAFSLLSSDEDLFNQLNGIDDAYGLFMDEIYGSTLASFEQVNFNIINADFEYANSILESISINDNFEQSEFKADTVYLNSWAKGRYDLDAGEIDLLERYAYGDPMTYGPAVYTARVMLGIDAVYSARKSKEEIVSNIIIDNGIKVYPNPSTGNLTVESNVDIINGNLEIYSLLGGKLFEFALNERITNLQLSQLKQGVYFYRVLENKNILSAGKLIINR